MLFSFLPARKAVWHIIGWLPKRSTKAEADRPVAADIAENVAARWPCPKMRCSTDSRISESGICFIRAMR